MKNLDSSIKEFIEMMFQALFDDFSSGMSEAEAGWRIPNQVTIEQPNQIGLLSSDMIERNPKGEVRLNFRNYQVYQELKKTFSLQSNQLEYFLNSEKDETKLSDAQKILYEIVKIIQESPEIWKYIVSLGWWRMLVSSGMPALVDDVLSEGFSPGDWTVKAISSSHELALGLSQRFGDIKEFNEAIDFLTLIKIPLDNIILPSPVDQNDMQRVKKILKWADIEKELTEPVIKTLGFSWFAFLALDSTNLFPTSNEVIVKLHKIIWDAIEQILGKSQPELLNELKNIMTLFELNQIIWASDIIRIPEPM